MLSKLLYCVFMFMLWVSTYIIVIGIGLGGILYVLGILEFLINGIKSSSMWPNLCMMIFLIYCIEEYLCTKRSWSKK